ncbi:flagellar motor protein MotB [Salinispirillum marinum]|uniref:Flagellar motor protein MotB n=2 Tax=Saccharospirillaceae TaxID=255527 RepID=A0ABV8BER5_9GAMM
MVQPDTDALDVLTPAAPVSGVERSPRITQTPEDAGGQTIQPWVPIADGEQWVIIERELNRLHEVLPEQLNYDWYRTDSGAMLALSADSLFAPGDYVLRADQVGAVERVAETLKTLPVLVAVAGHVDDRALSSEAAWQLSSRRAASVVSVLARVDIAPQRLSAVGYAGALPQVPNDTADQRAINRRMELILTVVSDIPKVESALADTLPTIYPE